MSEEKSEPKEVVTFECCTCSAPAPAPGFCERCAPRLVTEAEVKCSPPATPKRHRKIIRTSLLTQS